MINHFYIYFTIISLLLTSCYGGNSNDNTDKKVQTTLTQQFKVEIFDSTALDIIDKDATFEVLAKGFYWSEGPLWVEELNSLIFSDVPANKIYKWNEDDSLSIYLESAGHSGNENKNSNRGPNGLIFDKNNNLLICQHGDRRIAMLDADIYEPRAKFNTIADKYEGNKFNSPNDIDIDRDGNIYFTDPPYGMPDNKTGEIGINGVFRINPENEVSLLIDSLTWPNGIGLSPDEQTLYINQSDPQNPILYSYTINDNGELEEGKILYDFKDLSITEKGLPDGLKVHKSGNIFATGPGGVHIIRPDGKLLATINTVKASANCAFDSDQKYLYTTTTDMLLRVKLK